MRLNRSSRPLDGSVPLSSGSLSLGPLSLGPLLGGLLSLGLLVGLAACAPGPESSTSEPTLPETRTLLSDGWTLQAAAQVEADGAAISSADFHSAGWIETTVPTTVLAAQMKAQATQGTDPDPYFSDRLDKIDTEPFKAAWWYRTTFELDAVDESLSLAFDGINYRAAVWLNGELVAGTDAVYGSFKRFDLPIGAQARVGTNVLAVEVHPPQPGDFTLGFVDWNPVPPDRNMGLWREVWLRSPGAVSVDDVVVFTELTGDVDAGPGALLTMQAELHNRLQDPVSGSLSFAFDGRDVELPYELAGGERRIVKVDAAQNEALKLDAPRLWWPHTLGEPNLYNLDVSVSVAGQVSDHESLRFGVREVEDYFNAEGHRGYRVNGKDFLLRGGGWVDDLMLADTEARIEAQMDYVKHLGLNTVRLEGFWGSSRHLYNVADEKGILLMPGWSCQWEWEEYLGKPVDEEFGGVQTEEDMALVVESLEHQVTWLRRHPSIFVWVLASDLLPKPDLERRYADMMETVDTSRPLLASCATRDSEVSGPTGAKMNGPYDWVPPVYWFTDRVRGGAFGFNTETGPGPQPPPMESLRRMIPEANLWPIDKIWEYHCGRHQFQTLDRYTKALDARYGAPDGLEDFLLKSQAANLEAMRAMFEAFSIRRPEATGVVQWMLNSAWPELYWQLYDHYLLPNGAYYGTRRANAPWNLVYDYGDGSVWVARDELSRALPDGLKAEMRLFDLESKEIWSQDAVVPADMAVAARLTSLDDAHKASPVTFLDLRLKDGAGNTVGQNLYWLSAKDDVPEPDPEKSSWVFTPTKEFADLKALADLPATTLEVSATVQASDDPDQGAASIRLKNTGTGLAFLVELRLVDPATDRSYLPVFFDDNYVTLLPGEERTLAARYSRVHVGTSWEPETRHDGEPTLRWFGWNVESGEAALGTP